MFHTMLPADTGGAAASGYPLKRILHEVIHDS